MLTITSVKNEKVKIMASLAQAKGRKEHGLFLIEGPKMLAEAEKQGMRAQILFVREDLTGYVSFAAQETYAVTDAVLEKVCGAVTPQGCVGAYAIPKQQEICYPAVFLDGVQDPGNAGTIWRTCEAAGFQSILFGGACADPYSPKVVRSTMGAVLRIPAVVCADAQALAQRVLADGANLITSRMDAPNFFARSPLQGKNVLVIGSEGHGVSVAVDTLATHSYSLPMAGKTESLNAAMAAGIMMYDLFRLEGSGQ